MSNTNIEDTVNGFLASYGTTEDPNALNHKKDPQSKNIALSEWNDIVQLLGVRSDDVKRLYEALEAIREILGKAELADAAVERIDSYLKRPQSGDISIDYLSRVTSTEQTIKSNVTIDPSKKLSAGTVSANKVEGTSADFTSEVNAGSVNSSGNVVSGGDVSGATGTFTNLTATSLTVKGDSTVKGALSVDGDVHAKDVSANNGTLEGDLTVLGALFVHGSTIEVGRESLTVKDNVIVVNAGGSADIPSGIVMSTGVTNEDGTIDAYALLYKKSGTNGEAVYVGKGILTYVETDDGPAAEFSYAPGEAVALAARSGTLDDGILPAWDANSNTFVSSGATMGDIATAFSDIEQGLAAIEAIQDAILTTEDINRWLDAILEDQQMYIDGGNSDD